jgi:hypothetical protein
MSNTFEQEKEKIILNLNSRKISKSDDSEQESDYNHSYSCDNGYSKDLITIHFNSKEEATQNHANVVKLSSEIGRRILHKCCKETGYTLGV